MSADRRLQIFCARQNELEKESLLALELLIDCLIFSVSPIDVWMLAVWLSFLSIRVVRLINARYSGLAGCRFCSKKLLMR